MEPLIVRRTIRATPQRLFAAWTDPAQLLQWWGPAGVECVSPEVNLRPGGTFRIGNRLPDGNVLWIHGAFEVVEPPRKLVYTWLVGEAKQAELVTVTFEPAGPFTEVAVLHERITDARARETHAYGWTGCLDGLEELIGAE